LVLIVGSPKNRGGTSLSLGDYILGKLPNDKFSTETFHAVKALRKDDDWEKLATAVADADTVILSFPLYWDSMPSHVIRTMERLDLNRKIGRKGSQPNFYLIVNNGFPEPWHNEIAIGIGQRFAGDMDFKWQGALNIGGGGAIGGKQLEDMGGMTYKLRETLDMAAEAIGKSQQIPEDVKQRLSKPLYPAWFNIIFGGFGWRSLAKKRGMKGSIKAMPYERTD
jgi:hypothetical protein